MLSPKIETRLLYLDHVVERGRDLYDLACRRDLEGIIAEWVQNRPEWMN
jgi:ATP-dependent DNA ligase